MACAGFGFRLTPRRNISRWFILPFASSTRFGAFTLRASVGPLWACALGEINGLHATGRIALDFVAATKADQSGKNSSNHPIFPSRPWDGLGRSVVGTLPPRHAWGALHARSC